jgi:hypothetical protein
MVNNIKIKIIKTKIPSKTTGNKEGKTNKIVKEMDKPMIEHIISKKDKERMIIDSIYYNTANIIYIY